MWMSYRVNGKWIDRSTGYSAKNPIERKDAEKLRRQFELNERLEAPITAAGGWEWVDTWMSQRWNGGTGYQYRKNWRKIQEWITEKKLVNPTSVTREHCLGYKTWRVAQGVKENTAILEAKFLGQIMEEAVEQKRCAKNPARKLGLKREPVEGKRAWTDEELATVDTELKKTDPYGWMRATYLLGRYQAARIGSCEVLLRHIDLNRQVPTVHFAKPKGGRGKAYTQPIDPRLLPDLRAIVEHRQKIGAATLCDLPHFERAKKKSDGHGPSSLEWRAFLDGLGIHGVSHHDLRRTWITEAAISRVPEALACKFSNHSSTAVHRIYQAFTTDDMAAMVYSIAQPASGN